MGGSLCLLMLEPCLVGSIGVIQAFFLLVVNIQRLTLAPTHAPEHKYNHNHMQHHEWIVKFEV